MFSFYSLINHDIAKVDERWVHTHFILPLQLAFVAVNGHMAICRAVFVCRRTRSDADGIVIRIISGNGGRILLTVFDEGADYLSRYMKCIYIQFPLPHKTHHQFSSLISRNSFHEEVALYLSTAPFGT